MPILALTHDFQEVLSNVAEVLRQVQNSQVPVGGWVGGDAWFGSVASCVAVSKELSVESTFVVKQHVSLFPKAPLMAVLRARHGARPAGHWVVMTAEISGVKLLAIAFAWSQSSISFFISTVGTTAPASESYQSSFEDEYGNKCTKLINRPEIVDFIYRFLPLIDNHNKSRQHLLRLERKWPTRSCWFRLYTTLIGFSVVDLYRLYRYHDETKWQELTINQFADMLCLGLRPRERTHLPDGLKNDAVGADLVKRIRDKKTGEITKAITRKQQTGKHYRQAVGSAVQKTCWVCRMYTDKDKYTSFSCTKCDTPLCHPSKENPDREWKTCVMEHNNSCCQEVRCNGVEKGRVTKKLKK
jgi:hypothetical protein